MEGRARYNGSLYGYEYDLKDNLGNTRVTVNADPADATQRTAKVIQENSYYPFGMTMPNADINFAAGVKNNYLYNGKEMQEELGQLDYGARFYDSAIGRWAVLDPLSESHYDQSAYTYVLNNPIRFIDPFGLKEEESNVNYEIDLPGVNIEGDNWWGKTRKEIEDRRNARTKEQIATHSGLGQSSKDDKEKQKRDAAAKLKAAKEQHKKDRETFKKFGTNAKQGGWHLLDLLVELLR